MSQIDLPEGLVRQPDGVYLDARLAMPALQTAVDALFRSGYLFTALDYPAFCRALYGSGPALAPQAALRVRIADAVHAFDPQRKSLYRPLKLGDGVVEYIFEPLYLEAEELSDGTSLPERPVQLDFDEFVAELWTRGIRFGIEEATVRAALAAQRGERTTVAKRLPPSPATDARIVEVAPELHRSDAPKERADGRLDMTSFQNRFPQIKHGVRLLQKIPGSPGTPGIETSGAAIAPLQPADIDFARYAGPGTLIERTAAGEFLVASQDGFLDVDNKTGQIAVNDKIISRDGVSGRTTGNLELMGAFEEMGDVQELRDVNGSDITVHGDVYGNIHSSGGTIVLGRNLVGGKVHNVKGDIRIGGVASGSLLQGRDGTITVSGRADSCVISARRVVVEEASNCEIFADEVEIKLAVGCAIAGRSVQIESAGPRKSSEMFVYVLVRDVSGHARELTELLQQAEGRSSQLLALQAEHAALAGTAEVHSYLALADRLRKGELQLTAAQVPHLKKLAAAVAPQVKQIGLLLQAIKTAEAQQQASAARVAELEELKRSAAARSTCTIHMIDGDTLVRTLPLSEAAAAAYELPAKDYKAMLRGPRLDSETLFAGASGTLNWHGAAAS